MKPVDGRDHFWGSVCDDERHQHLEAGDRRALRLLLFVLDADGNRPAGVGPDFGAGTSMTHRDQNEYQKLAEAALPGGAVGTRLMEEGLRMTIASARGSRIVDVEGNERLDYVCGAGAHILGYQHPAVVEAVRGQATRAIHHYGGLSDVAIELATELVAAIPCAERMVFGTTGSEATFYALRMARAFTGRRKILKFEGAFHGNHDYAAYAVAPTEPTIYPRGLANTAGIPDPLAETVLIAPYNDLDAVESIVSDHAGDLAAIIVEPVQRIIRPRPGFLAGLRELCDRTEALLIFDEVVTGFRLAYGGAQEYFGVIPDLAAYGKIIGGGGPLSCVAGRAEIIDLAHPYRTSEPDYVYASGTLHGNPLAAAAGLATLRELRAPGFYDELHRSTARLATVLRGVLDEKAHEALVVTEGSLWQILHMLEPPAQYTDFLRSDRAANVALDTELVRNGIHVLPGVRRFVSSAHTDRDFEQTAYALDRACEAVRRNP